MMGGNWGKILKVDLTSGKTEELELDEKLYRDFLGGSGLAAKWFFDNEGWKVEPLSPENPLMIMNGPLSGTNLPGVSRLEICARSPLTGIWGEASMGGHFSPQLKRTGYDGIIVVGASEKPVYLYLTDEKVEIKDASHLWGKDTYETEDLLKEEVGDKRAQVISIGPAGENLVKFACVMNDRGSTAGRCGMGAVMGSKKLKAVVARGNKKVPVADEAAFKASARQDERATQVQPDSRRSAQLRLQCAHGIRHGHRGRADEELAGGLLGGRAWRAGGHRGGREHPHQEPLLLRLPHLL